MGKIYRAEQVPLGRAVALKILRTRYADEVEDDPQFQKRFFLEASILSKLEHNNIVRLYDYGRIEGNTEQYFMAMELLQGETLTRRLKARGALSILEVVRIARQIAKGLYAAHKLEIVHRDLKPSNIMLVPEEDGGEIVKILDFGISKIMKADSEDLTAEGAFLGSPRYMSPEQVSEGKVDLRSDIYSLGVIMYEALCGKIPFDGDSNIGIMMAHCNNPIPAMRERSPNVAVPDVLEALVVHCLQKGANLRPRSMEEFLRELGACEAALSGGQLAALSSSGSLPLSGPISVPPSSARTSSNPRISNNPIKEPPTITGVMTHVEVAPPSGGLRPSSAPTGTHRSLTRSQVPGAVGAAQPQKSAKWIVVAIVAVIAVLGITGAALVFRTPPPPPVAPSGPRASFTLILESTPSSAEVREGDAVLGATPLRLPIDHTSVAGAPRKFIVTRAGYAPYTVYQGDSTDDLRILAALVAEPIATAAATPASASAAPSATTTTAHAAPPAHTASSTPAATRVTNNPDLDIKLKR
jgi:serine/threonine-protein kinase